MIRRILFLTVVLALAATTAAQDNLLTNGGLEEGEFGPYSGRGRGDLTIPAGWNVWLGQGSTEEGNFFNRGDRVFGFPHRGPGPDPVEGSLALNFSGGYVQYNVAIYQTVAVAEGTNLRAEYAAQIKVCSTPDNEPGFCGSDPSSGAQTRIGIDTNGGTDPNSGGILWSPWLRPHDTWNRTAVEATASGPNITVFIYFTQDKPYVNNQIWLDDVKLTTGGEGGTAPAEADGEASTDEGGEVAAPPPLPNTVPFVNPQGERDDGSVIHTVQQGDTLDSIAVAYGLSRTDLIERNPNLASTRFLQIGQQITISPPQEAAPVPDEEAAPLPPATDEEANDVVINDDPKGLGGGVNMSAFMERIARFFSEDLTFVPAEGTTGNSAEVDTVAAPPGAIDLANVLEVADAGDVAGAIDIAEALSAFGTDATEDEAVTDMAAATDETADEPVTDTATDEAAAEPVTDTATDEAAAEPVTDTATDETADEPVTDTATDETDDEPVTDAAPVVVAADLPVVDVAASSVAVCVSVFEDRNQNRLREDSEPLLAGGGITLMANGEAVTEYETDGTSEPFCITDLNVGEYTAAVTPPTGYGLTTPAQLRLPLTAGAALNIEVGAAEGIAVAAVPPPDADTAEADLGDSAAEVLPANLSITDNLMAISGVIVAVLAGIVVLAGIGAAVLLRRAN